MFLLRIYMKLNTRGCKNSKMQSSSTGKGREVDDSGANSDVSLDEFVIIEFIGFQIVTRSNYFFRI